MGILAWIILGAVAGALAKFLHPGPDPGGWIMTIIIGIVGSFVGGIVVNLVGGSGVTGLNLWSIIVATLGAFICLWLYGKFGTRRA